MADYFIKDPAAMLDYAVDWSRWLAEGETIATSTWTVPAGITSEEEANNSTAAQIWLAGGSVGKRYRVTNKIITSAERQNERTITIEVQNQ